ncbi:caspase 8 [Mytilus galloprovincialis]|uniref:Caspase-8 n=1 Tax=Mytilus galloprovincialis TaxID=29158 RepID=A0A8B6CSA5_MYTGA|nr:caspase 8 [Mytilus galloprovincialis]
MRKPNKEKSWERTDQKKGYLMFNDVTPLTDKAMALNDEKYEYKDVKTKTKVRCCKTHCLPHPMFTKKTENPIDESKNSEEAYTESSSDVTATDSGIHVNVYEPSSRNSSVTEFDNCNITFESTVENIHGNHGNFTLAKAEVYKSEESGNCNFVLCAKIPEKELILSVESDYGLMLKYELIRLSTFKVVKTPVSALKLATNGFFYTSNMTRCFSCGVTYEGWDLCDNVSDVHSMISPGCEMVLGTETMNKSVNDKTTKEMFRELEISSGLKNNVIHESPMAKYKMTAQPRGIAVIINNELFDGQLEDRDGTNKDSEQLTKLLTDLKFKVDIHHNLTAEKMISIARASAKLNHTDYDCFVFCVLTHGANGVLYGKDEIGVEIQQIIDFYQSSRCPSLAGKPKMFFIQACQGINPQAGQQLPTDTINIDQDTSRKETIPNEADILVSFSTVTGCVSFRCPQNGTWFINSLVENLRKYSKYLDIITIITKVNEDVGRKSLQEGSNTHKQIPIYKSTLCKHVFLNS